ncbi:histone-like nucleoid-structuring protein Lsr2 [Streptomyces sp. STCH 565 A]|uniref:zinc-ribbon domain-containing protein n=1 Tax=Streptomyces sp. STCH 565 A TaxID=2950532 RepID=UPI002075554F|nr:histone-like nucleoid-structuring protein Lsr2 [Streptomyces sp. STCH 565 A]MCM8555410.1 zinc-ribbon domain-containing protein [Streptomyces sp. STCH 565 A]
MLGQMRGFWKEQNQLRRERIQAEVEAARARQAEVHAYWNRHKTTVTQRWANRTTGRGQAMVADIPEVAAQWHPDNSAQPEDVSATADRRKGPYLWQCPLGLGHEPWPATPKDRVRSGAGCPACRQLTRLADIPTLADQYRGPVPVSDMNYASHERVPWICRTWAVDPGTGSWQPVEHCFEAVVKDRALQADACRVCAGYVVDDTNSLRTWFPEIADELDDPDADACRMPTSRHNVSRRQAAGEESGGVYATLPWRCRHGHGWEATILNRVQGGGCPACSLSGISKEQVRLVAELAGLMDLVPPGPPDPRLPDGLPDFSSHQLVVPLQHKPEHWRYKAVEVDAVFQLAAGIRVGVEYDGAFHHSTKRRDRRQYESEKGQVLVAAGLLDLLVHVRLRDLPLLETAQALAVPVPERSTVYQQACAAAAAIEARFPGSVPGIDAYLTDGHPRRQDQADAYILALWGELRPPRRRPARTQPRCPRPLKETIPRQDSLLTPASAPYRNPDRPAEILRDYRCACGNPRQFTAVQAQVTSGNTKSCGCLQRQAKRQRRASLSGAETRAVREWARQQGIDVGTSGRVPDRVTASWRLHRAGRLDVLAADGLLDERRVQQWTQTDGVHLGARGRVTSGAWLAYAEHCLGPDDSHVAAVRQPVRTVVQESLFELSRPDSSRIRSGPLTL